jgi:hypothetical protein
VLLRLLTGPLRGLLGNLLGLGGGEEYRREATQIVLDLQQGRQPAPASVAALLEKLSPTDREKARSFLQQFVEKQEGPGKVPPAAWRCTSMMGLVLVEPSDTLEKLARILCQTPRAECSQIEDAVLLDGAFPTAEDKRRAMELLKEARIDCTELAAKPVRR